MLSIDATVRTFFGSANRQVGFVLGIFAIALTMAAPSQAELAWEHKTVEVNGDATSTVLEAHFKFTNDGGAPVEIRKVESSCGCTTTALEKWSYQPQEHGEIVAKYTVGTHTGLQKKTILVVANDGKPPTTLTLVAHIQEILKITPTLATWTHKAAPTPKHLTLEWLPAGPLDEIRVESSDPDMATEVLPVTKGRKYDLLVSPRQTDRFLSAKLTLHCRAGNQEKVFVAFATVQPGPTGQ